MTVWPKTVLIFGSLICLGRGNELSFKPIVNVTKSDYWISFEDKAINSVLFYAEVNKKCPGKYVYAFNSTLSHPWVMQDHFNSGLKENKMRLYTLVNAADKFYSKSFDITMNPGDANSNIIKSVDHVRKNPKLGSPICAKLRQSVDKPKEFCIPTETKMSSTSHLAPKCSGELIFSADFVDAIDYSIWTPHICVPKTEVVSYTNDTSTAFIKDNRLHLRINKTSTRKGELFECTSAKPKRRKARNDLAKTLLSRGYMAAKLHSNNTFSFQNGRIEIRAKMPIGNWIMPIMDLTSRHNGKLAIRLAFARGNENLLSSAKTEIGGRRLFGGIRDGKSEYIVDKLSTEHHGRQIHNYTVIWHKDRIIYKINGKTYGTITHNGILAKLQKDECFFNLGITVGGATNFQHQNIDRDSQTADYVDFNNNRAGQQFKERPRVWEQQELIIESLKVYSTHALEE